MKTVVLRDKKIVVKIGRVSAIDGYIHPTGDGNSHVPATGTTSDGKVLLATASEDSAYWGVLLHNNRSDLQGGTSGEYFHLTSADSAAWVARQLFAGEIKGTKETEQSAVDATSGGTVDILFANGQIIPITIGTVDITFTFSDLPIGGSMTLELAFTGASKPSTITWPSSLLGPPDVSGATDLTGYAAIEVRKSAAGLWIHPPTVV
jgi:hypothetical protein